VQALASLCVRRPVFASVLILSLVVVGLFAYFNLGVDRFPKVLQQQQQPVRINRRFFETEVQVESPRPIVNGVNKDSPDANNAGGFLNAAQCVEEQGLTESLPLLCLIHGQPRKQHHADRMIGQAFGDPLRAFVFVHGAGGESVVSGHATAFERHVGFGRSGLLVRPRELSEPFVQGCIGAIERRSGRALGLACR